MSLLDVTPGLIDAILLVVALELVALGAVLIRSPAARLFPLLFWTLASGAGLLAALRAALAGSDARVVALALLAAGIAHAASLWQLHRALPAGSRRGRGEAAG